MKSHNKHPIDFFELMDFIRLYISLRILENLYPYSIAVDFQVIAFQEMIASGRLG
jgi:hypothetical protein